MEEGGGRGRRRKPSLRVMMYQSLVTAVQIQTDVAMGDALEISKLLYIFLIEKAGKHALPLTRCLLVLVSLQPLHANLANLRNSDLSQRDLLLDHQPPTTSSSQFISGRSRRQPYIPCALGSAAALLLVVVTNHRSATPERSGPRNRQKKILFPTPHSVTSSPIQRDAPRKFVIWHPLPLLFAGFPWG